jgi:uncharacterized protein (DUF2147 family)
MQKVVILFLALSLFSCKKKSIETGYALGETNWTLYFKNNSSFSFYAVSQLSFYTDYKVKNFRSADTILGTWKTKNNAVSINFESGDVYTGTIFSDDSISGSLTASGSNGDWYAIRQ